MSDVDANKFKTKRNVSLTPETKRYENYSPIFFSLLLLYYDLSELFTSFNFNRLIFIYILMLHTFFTLILCRGNNIKN